MTTPIIPKKFHYFYRITCTVTNRYYLGMHSTDDLADGYLGSGTRLWKSKKKHGKENHILEILEYHSTREALSAREEEMITEEVLADPMCLNLRRGGTGHYPGKCSTEETKVKIAEGGKKRWAKEKAERSITNDVPLIMTREQVLAELVTESGHLNKNATRSIKKVLEVTEIPSRTREANVIKRWRAVHTAIDNPEFPELVEQINAYVHGITSRPVCKICQKPVTFFRFNQPYATYCGSKCQLLDPSQNNPVASRWLYK